VTIKVIALDFDSTLIVEESLNVLAARLNLSHEISRITEQAMAGEIDFTTSIHKRVEFFAGVPLTELKKVAASLTLSPGAKELIEFCQGEQIQIAIISGGFIEILNSFTYRNNFNHIYANSLEISGDRLTGKVSNLSIDAKGKAIALSNLLGKLGIASAQSMAIGDGANDLEMLKIAGVGVSFKGKPVLDSVADICIQNSLDEVIPYLQAPEVL
jgi:phosphoserine phosphatase